MQFNFAPTSVIAGFIPATHSSALLVSEYLEEWVPEINAGMTIIGKVWLDPLRQAKALLRRGFGSVRVKAMVGETPFETSIFPDVKSGCYLLPVKAAVRQGEKIGHGDQVACLIELAKTL